MGTETVSARFRVGARVQLVDDIVRSHGKLKTGAQGTVVVADLPWGHYSVQFDHGGPQTPPREWLHIHAVELARKPTSRLLGIGVNTRNQEDRATPFPVTPTASWRHPSSGEVWWAAPDSRAAPSPACGGGSAGGVRARQ